VEWLQKQMIFNEQLDIGNRLLQKR